MVHRHVSQRRARAIEAVDAGTATFDDWFVAQYGPRPNRLDIAAAKRALQDAENDVVAQRLVLEVVENYDRDRDAALKAWAAREDQIKRKLARLAEEAQP